MFGLLLAPIVLYVLFRLFEHSQVYQPRRALIADPSTIHPQAEDRMIASGKHRLHLWFFPAIQKSQWSDWAILISHGNGGNISHRLELYQLWLEAGFSVVAYDYRGYGKSSGIPSEQGTYEDVENVYEWLRKKGFAKKKIIALGESLGAAVATELALRQVLGGLILQSAFTKISDIGKELFPWLPVETLGSFDYNTLGKLPKIKTPLLILHSRKDRMIPFAHAERNFQSANSPKHFGEISGDHNDPIFNSADDYRSHIETFKTLLNANHDDEKTF